MTSAALPAGRLLSWYGDDFTGSAAVLEVLAFSGIKSVLFLGVPTAVQLASFQHCRAIGIAGVARSQPPEWMDENLPAVFDALAEIAAPIAHYKVCSTFNSSPRIGSIGRAIDLAVPRLGGAWHPMLIAAPAIGRYQAFGNLFAAVGGVAYRLDRHPVMSRHPVTPMGDSDVRSHLARQTDRSIGTIDLVGLRRDGGVAALQAGLKGGTEIFAVDGIDEADLAAAGELIWTNRGERLLAIGSQGVEYALVAHWQGSGALPPSPPLPRAAPVSQIAVVSGSVSGTTAAQIGWAIDDGFAPVPFDAAAVVDEAELAAAIEDAVAEGRRAFDQGRSPLLFSARGPDDPAVGRFRSAVAAASLDPAAANLRVGKALGRALDRLLSDTGIERAVISGGDTSGYASLELGVYALSALAPTIPGAALFKAHCHDGSRNLELALKGGQMGSTDYFGWIRDGGGARP